MTRKDFEVIADVLKSVRPQYVADVPVTKGAAMQWDSTVIAFADRCKLINPRFDNSKFYQACGWLFGVRK